jgi:hypothetical protein
MPWSQNTIFSFRTHTVLFTSNTFSSTSLTMKVFQIFTLAALTCYAVADIVVDNEILDPKAIYDFITSDDSAEDWKSTNTKKYYCTYRNLWTKIDHPNEYPQFARLSDFILYSSTTGFLPWLIGRQTTVGVETLAEVSSSFHSSSNQSINRLSKASSLHILPTVHSHSSSWSILLPPFIARLGSMENSSMNYEEREPKFMTNVQRMPILSIK